MLDLFDDLGDRIRAAVTGHESQLERHHRDYRCGRCAAPLAFEDLTCANCNATLGYLPDERHLAVLHPAGETNVWRAEGRRELLNTCANREQALCNWVLLAEKPHIYCVACRLNRTIPNLSEPDNLRYWQAIERAKRRLVSQLLAMSLPVRSKLSEDPEHGVMFDFLRAYPGGPRVITGHDNGLITINVEEADDAKREAMRHALREPYRTLLGHFRHEIGHYYWDRLIWGTPWLERFRALFGDERASYSEAVTRNYTQGPPPDWALAHISAYATMHPWEDWAETWAHYMHIADSLGVALGYGLDLERDAAHVADFGPDALYAPDDPFADRFLELLNAWRRMTRVLNQLARSLGEPDFYPFTISAPVVAKLQFIQLAVADARTRPGL